MAKTMNRDNEDTQPATSLALAAGQPGILMPADAESLKTSMFGEASDFATEKTFWIGDPAQGKVPFYFGELIGQAADVAVEAPGSKPDPTTGEIKMNMIPAWMFYPANPKTLVPFKRRIDTILCSHQVHAACVKYAALAKEAGGRAQLFLQWDGKSQTRKGNQMNNITVMYRFAVDVVPATAAPDGTNG